MRQLKVPLGFGALLPHGPPNKDNAETKGANEQQGSDYSGRITNIEEELCTMEGREGKEAANSSGKKDGAAYCWTNAMGETTAENSRTTSVSRAWRVSARWLKDIVKAKDKKTASVAAWKLLSTSAPVRTLPGRRSRSWKLRMAEVFGQRYASHPLLGEYAPARCLETG